uniref:Intraflagellar transport protein 46 homolog n=1 Tax=Strigamia maritima TaxID=126957 RepID=T1J6N3_STRMM
MADVNKLAALPFLRDQKQPPGTILDGKDDSGEETEHNPITKKFQPMSAIGRPTTAQPVNDEDLDESVVVKPAMGLSNDLHGSSEELLDSTVTPGTSAINPEEETNNNNSEESEDEDDDDDDSQGAHVEGAYDPTEFEDLNVTLEIKELFQFITRYTPQTIELEHKLKPFIPDFIPAVGDIDAFIKVGRPDSKPEMLGLIVLDEPCSKQSDQTVLDLQLRAVSKQASLKTVIVKQLENAGKNPKEIDKWIKSISDLHKSKPPPTVHYSKPMPDIENLMQEWDPQFEELLKEVGLPSADTDCDLSQYVDVICGLLDIPIYKSKIQALHVLFTLYSEFKNSQHFRQLAEENLMDNTDKENGGERLVL